MATWNVGPFDNDDAVEWCDRLNDLAPARRAEFVERTLSDAVSQPTALNAASSSEIFAAAATVLQATTGTPTVTTPYAAALLTETEGIDPTPRLIGLARAAVVVILTGESAFRRKWANHVEEDLALETVERIQHGLMNG